MSLTDKQRSKMTELAASCRKRKKEREIARIKAEMTAEIANFSQKYEFADGETAKTLKKLLSKLPYKAACRIDLDKLSEHKEFCTENADKRKVWFCSLCGSMEIFEVFVSGNLADFLDDYDDWYFYGAYMLLVYEDFGGFVYIDDNGNMTETFI